MTTRETLRSATDRLLAERRRLQFDLETACVSLIKASGAEPTWVDVQSHPAPAGLVRRFLGFHSTNGGLALCWPQPARIAWPEDAAYWDAIYNEGRQP